MATVNFHGHQVSDSVVKQVLQNLCDYFQASVDVTSGDRTTVPEGGSPKSLHLLNRAADFHIEGIDDGTIYLNLRNLGFQQVFTSGHRYEFIWHGLYTGTSGAHLHLGRIGVNQNGYIDFIFEGITPEGKNKYPLDIRNTISKGVYQKVYVGDLK
jgi:hypothetical protein